MIQTKDDWIGVGIGLGLSLIAIYAAFRLTKKNTQSTDNTIEEPPVQVTTYPKEVKKEKTQVVIQKPAMIWPLQQGSTGKEVERLQIWLLRNHGWKGTITKVFDTQTEKLVQRIFKKNQVDKTMYDKHQMGTPIHELIKA